MPNDSLIFHGKIGRFLFDFMLDTFVHLPDVCPVPGNVSLTTCDRDIGSFIRIVSNAFLRTRSRSINCNYISRSN